MATISTIVLSRTGVQFPSTPADEDGDKFPNTGREFLVFKNDSAEEREVSLIIVQSVDGQTPEPRVVDLPLGETTIVGPFPTDDYNSPVDGLMAITYDDAEDITVGFFRMTMVQ
jgi:hypothetical protein